jgi:hypothetical protein
MNAKASYKIAALSAVVFSTFAIVGTAGSAAAAAASDNGPNDAYCLNDVASGSPWCGYATFEQCEQSASAIGADCVANAFGEESSSPYDGRKHTSR